MRRWAMGIIGITLLGTAVALARPARPDNEKEKVAQAVKAAESWLSTVDQGRYEASWDESARYFQKAVGKKTWVQQVRAVREPLGAVVSRKVIRTQLTRTLPGAPDGAYVVIQTKTVFAHKKRAVETITPVLDGARGWRVTGYYVR